MVALRLSRFNDMSVFRHEWDFGVLKKRKPGELALGWFVGLDGGHEVHAVDLHCGEIEVPQCNGAKRLSP